MRRGKSETAAFATLILICCKPMLAYEDDDLLCRPGWSPELYQQQIWEQNNPHRMSMMEYQYAMANAVAEQQMREAARRSRLARQEKAARKREDLIAKRKAENAAKTTSQAHAGAAANPAK